MLPAVFCYVKSNFRHSSAGREQLRQHEAAFQRQKDSFTAVLAKKQSVLDKRVEECLEAERQALIGQHSIACTAT